MPGIRARYWNAGHLLVSASIESSLSARANRGAAPRSAFRRFGPDAKLPAARSEAPAGFDYVISDPPRRRRSPADHGSRRRAHLAREVCDAAAAKGAMLIPALAWNESRNRLSMLIDLMQRGESPTAPVLPGLALGDPRRRKCFAQTQRASIRTSILTGSSSSPELRFTGTVDESKSIAKLSGFHSSSRQTGCAMPAGSAAI